MIDVTKNTTALLQEYRIWPIISEIKLVPYASPGMQREKTSAVELLVLYGDRTCPAALPLAQLHLYICALIDRPYHDELEDGNHSNSADRINSIRVTRPPAFAREARAPEYRNAGIHYPI
eukprot:gnl/TRDRNA2_/TRDRNA2_75732_c0_seq1.p1 gnl/TRDRNA2_/TRDRNA2_75732_c0~~gnl/TRDRNA2_/TRDRNA2_75732_c0_seq1.p1  ORF type:complete len:120 (+),score=5.64 gnl/TRDRNA2_/TRDRNA2_75732_c0_seq1:135-494(+)